MSGVFESFTDLWPPSVSDVIPSVAWAGVTGDGILSDERVTITGAHFRITPTVRWTLTTDPSVSFDAPMVNWISEGEITALCPSESMHMPVGFYYVDVINPEGLSGRRSVLFEVSDIPPPMIMDIDPERGAAADNITMTVTGRYFQEGAVVSFENADGTRTAVTTTFISSDELRCFIPGGTLAQGLHPVWVTNPDGREDVFYSYNATSSAAGHFNQPFELTPELLNTGRERHGSVFGCDDFGSSYIYVAGGVDSAKNVLSDTEFSEVSIFGNNSLWRQVLQYGSSTSPRVVSSMNVPREGFALVRYGKFLYAIGGAPLYTNVSTPPVIEALGSIERAFILGYETMPRIRLPVVHGGSGLPLGTWYYQVSAIGPWGESLGSKEVQARNANGVIDVCWGAVTGATSYNIYRSPAADGRAGTTRLLAVEVVGGCYTDDGRGVNQPAPGRLRGAVVAGGSLSTGWWVYRVTAVVGGRETVAGYREYVEITDPANGKVELRWDPVPGATFNLYRSQTAIPSVSGDEQSYLLVSGVSSNSYVDDGSSAVDISRPAPDGIPPLPPGTLSRWELLISPSLVSPREGLSAAIITVPSGSETVDDKTYLYVVGGRPDNSGTGYYDTVEKSEILPDGSLGGFIVEGSTLNTARAFLALTTTWNRDDTPVCPPPVEPPCEDLDGDGHDAEWCGGDDCNDYDSTIYPGAPEICEDGIDQDCDGADTLCDCTDPSFADQDGDGHLRLECEGDDCCDSGYEPVIGCDPSTASQIYPGATEICENGIDEDCDGCDPLCACSDPSVSDSDGDGYIAEECCGDDCDDTDPNIHPGATEILCNGIDENCDGFDPCFELFMMELPVSLDFRWNRWVVARFGSGFVSIPRPEPSRSVGTEPIYLVASQGDDVFTVSNTGLIDFEVSKVTSPDGLLTAWTTQVNSLPPGRRTYGHGALLYAGFTFILPGVDTESRGTEPQPQNSTVSRFSIDMTPPTPDLFIGSFQSAASQFSIPRSYYGIVRINSYVFATGGNDGGGAINSVEKIPE